MAARGQRYSEMRSKHLNSTHAFRELSNFVCQVYCQGYSFLTLAALTDVLNGWQMVVAITGATGFVGSRLVERLVKGIEPII